MSDHEDETAREIYETHNVVLVWIIVLQLIILAVMAGALWRAAGRLDLLLLPAPAETPARTQRATFSRGSNDGHGLVPGRVTSGARQQSRAGANPPTADYADGADGLASFLRHPRYPRNPRSNVFS